MSKVAIITAAGWKGTSSAFPEVDKGIPEPLLPIGAGQTILSRHIHQLRSLGYITFVGVGQPGSLYPQPASLRLREGHITVAGTYEGTRLPGPWTLERVEYVRKMGGIPILIEHPASKGLYNTVKKCILAIGYVGWDEMLITQGDYVFNDELLRSVLELPYPQQMYMTRHAGGDVRHFVYRFDAHCAEVHASEEPFDHNAPEGVKHIYAAMRKNLVQAGAPMVCAMDEFPSLISKKKGWTDVDYPSCYARLLEWLRDGRL